MILKYKDFEIDIYPEFGLTINSIKYKNKNYVESYADTDEMKSYKGFKQSWMIPFCGRIAEGKYIYNGKTYQLQLNRINENCAIHGLLYNKSFDFVKEEKLKNGVKYSFIHFYNNSGEGFPFIFETKICITISEKQVQFDIEVKNFTNQKMPLQIGWHPYFKLEENVENTVLQLPATVEIGLDEMKYPNGEVYAVHPLQEPKKIGEKKLDHCFKIMDKSVEVKTTLQSNSEKLHLITNNEHSNYLQIYTPQTRSSIALEPMTAEVNCFVSGKGLIHLESNASHQYSFKLVWE